MNSEWITMFLDAKKILICMLTCLLTATDLTCSADVNLARNKNTSSSPTWSPSSNAVDGDPSTYAEMADQYPAWWMVDLNGPKFINRVRIYNRKYCCADRLQKVSLLVSLTGQPNPSLTSTEWKRVFYQSSALGGLGDVKEIAIEPVLARFLAVVSEYNGKDYAVSIAEVEVYGKAPYDWGLAPLTEQSTTFRFKYDARLAVDGSFNTCPSRTESRPGQWWKGIFPSTVLLSCVVIYSADPDQCSGCYSDTFRLPLTVLTSPDITSTSPAQSGSGWTTFDGSIANYSDGGFILCEQNNFRRVKELAIVNSVDNSGVSLKEVIISDISPPLLSPANVRLRTASYESIELSFSSWNRSMPGDIEPERYIISWNGTVTSNNRVSLPHQANVFTLSVTATDLLPGTVYRFNIICSVRGMNQDVADQSNTATFSTRTCSAPSDPVLQLSQTTETVESRKRHRLSVSWRVSNINCARIKYKASLLRGTEQLKTESIDRSWAEFTDLDAYTNYTVTVEAENSVGLKSRASQLLTTDELEPYDPPTAFTVTAFNTSCIQLSWKPPNSPNGIITKYEYTCSFGESGRVTSISGAGLLQQQLFCGLLSASKVTCQVRATNSAGSGPYTAPVFVYTPVKVKDFPNLCAEHCGEATDGKLVLTLTPARLENPEVNIMSYIFIVKDESKEMPRRRRATEQIDAFQLFNITEAMRRNLTYYVTAELNSSLVLEGYRFTVGDGNTYGGYYNAPLEEGKMYSLWNGIRLKLENEIIVVNERGSNRFTVPRKATPSPTSPDNLAVTLASLFGGLVLIAVGVSIAMLLIRHRRHDKKRSSSSSKRPKITTADVQNDKRKIRSSLHDREEFVPLATRERENSGDDDTGIPRTSPAFKKHDRPDKQSDAKTHVGTCTADVNCAKPSGTHVKNSVKVPPSVPIKKPPKRSSPEEGCYGNSEAKPDSEPIPVDQMEWYTQSHQDLIDAQFTKLGLLPVAEMKVAALPENKGKSRYKGLYPVDQYRVILQRKDQSEGTDYINASHVQGYNATTRFIAAQGPTEATLEDFWLMIWQENPSAVVMVTNIVEEGKPKCAQYWPDEGASEVKFGDIVVGSFCVENWADFTLRTLRVSKKGTNRIVKQFQYRTWPDHGVPREINPFLLFYLKIQNYISSRSGPVLVHCSAGVGRTGTFISLSYLLEQAEAEGVVDPYQCVKRLRERRPNLVQAKEQYRFLHLVLQEALATKDFAAPPGELDQRINAAEVKTGQRDIIGVEFEHLRKRLSEYELEYKAAKVPTNRMKNRNAEILPCDSHRVFLNASAGDYINAVFLNGVREKDLMIATQLPLTNTVSDFWQMVLQYDCHAIVQMEQPNVDYFPKHAGSSMESLGMQLKCYDVQVEEFFTARCIKMTAEMGTKDIKLFEMTSSDCSSPESLLSVFDDMQSWQQRNGSHKIIVACMNGATRCGDFICCLNALSKFKVDQVVDVYNSVLLARMRRPEFIASMEQYVNIYRLLKAYRDGFSTYANFQ